MPDPRPRVAIYGRVSTVGHGQDVTLQTAELYDAARQRDWNIVATYVDDGVSGAKASRPALDQLLEAVRGGRVTLVAVQRLDRLARSVRNLLDIADHLRAYGVGLVSLRDAHVDTTTASGRFTLSILGSVAELERELIRERVVAGVRHAKSRGVHCGRPRRHASHEGLVAARRLLDDGWTWRETARAVGVPKDTLRRRLTEAGMLARNPLPAAPAGRGAEPVDGVDAEPPASATST